MNAETPDRIRTYLRQGLAATPVLLDRLLEGITADELDKRPDPARFTIREALCHLADWEGVWRERLQRIATEDTPFLPGYDEGQWAIDHDYAHANAAEQLEKFRAGREALSVFLADLPANIYGRKRPARRVGHRDIRRHCHVGSCPRCLPSASGRRLSPRLIIG